MPRTCNWGGCFEPAAHWVGSMPLCEEHYGAAMTEDETEEEGEDACR